MSQQIGSELEQQSEQMLLEITDLSVEFQTKSASIKALREVSMTVEKGQTVGIAGESGSGKSTLALAIVRYLATNARESSGTIKFKDKDLRELSEGELQKIRGAEIGHVAQNAALSLNPSMKVGEQIKESIDLHRDVESDSEAWEWVYDALNQVNIPDPAEIAERFPNSLSGGQQQRVLIATALACNPDLLILDEPTTGLDVTTQAKLLDLIDDLKQSYDMGIILITHDLGVLAQTADIVNILYAGEMMEQGPIEEVFEDPANPYTQALLASTPEMDRNKELQPIPGQIPSLFTIPEGCIFADRCEFATNECRTNTIPLETVREGHKTRCVNWETAMDNPIEIPDRSSRTKRPGETILEAENLVKDYDQGSFLQNLLGDYTPVKAVQGVSLEIREGEAVGLVGESGCGKSTIAEMLLGIQPLTEGVLRYRGKDVSKLSKEEEYEFRSEVGIIFQDPEGSLNPRKTVKEIIERPLKLFTNLKADERDDRVDELLGQMSCTLDLKTKTPHELSGGQQQRVAIARAFARRPSLVVLDEPVSALDVSIQVSILDLLDELREKYNTAYLLISHDMGVIQAICDKLSVMYLGKVVETGHLEDVMEPPFHPYTQALLSSIPTLDPQSDGDRIHLEGDVPSARNPPRGCSFHTRCPKKIGEMCEVDEPELQQLSSDSEGKEGHYVSCHLSESDMNEASESISD